MKLMLTSFGVGHSVNRGQGLFGRMPPVAMHGEGPTFVPEYSALFLAEKLIVDQTTYDALSGKVHPAYAVVAETIRLLKAEDLIEVVDYDSALREARPLLDKMLAHDLVNLAQWNEPLTQSQAIWGAFARANADLLQPDRNAPAGAFTPHPFLDLLLPHIGGHSWALFLYGHGLQRDVSPAMNPVLLNMEKMLADEVHGPSGRHGEFREAIVAAYLKYANANLVLSQKLGGGVFDWADFEPFYRQKFLNVGKERSDGGAVTDATDKLFSVAFPEYRIEDARSLVKVMRNKRVDTLRSLVQDAIDGKATFDQAFAADVLRKTRKIDATVQRWRSMASFVTKPLSLLSSTPFVGDAIQTGIEKVITEPIARHLQAPYRWFYLLEQVAESRKPTALRKLARRVAPRRSGKYRFMPPASPGGSSNRTH